MRRVGAERRHRGYPDDAAEIGEDVRQTVRKLVELGLVVDGGDPERVAAPSGGWGGWGMPLAHLARDAGPDGRPTPSG